MPPEYPRRLPHNVTPFFTTDDAAAAYKHFLPRVLMIPIERIQVCRVEPVIVQATVQRSLDAIAPHLTQIREELPKVSLKNLLELPALALGLIFVAGRMGGSVSSKAIEGRLALRDRFWTALFEGYGPLRRAGVYLFGEDGVDARIPVLKVRKVSPLSTRSLNFARAPSSTSGPISPPA